MKIFIGYLLVSNIVSFLAFGADKRKARRGAWRTPEKVLLLLAVIGGSIGAFLGMELFRHKTKTPAFAIGIPVILILQAVAAGVYLVVR